MFTFQQLLVALVFWSSFGYSQNSIIGTILCQEPIHFSAGHIHVANKVVLANSKGVFKVENLPEGDVKIHISYAAYKTIDTIITLNKEVQLTFILEPNTTNLHEVVVKQKTISTTKTVVEQQIKAATIERFSNQALGDVLREVAGVSSLKTGSNIVKPIINGLYGSRVPIIANNVRLEDQQWGVEHAPNFDINMANKITVIKGAAGLQYSGDAIGGLVIIDPLVVKNDSLFGKTIVSYDSNGKGGTVSTSVHKGATKGFSYDALATLKYFGDKTAANYVLSNTGNREASITGTISYIAKKQDIVAFYSLYKTTTGILSAAHTGSANDLFQSIKNKIPSVLNSFTYSIDNPKQEVRHQIAKVNYHYHFDETKFLSVQYAFQKNQRLEFDLRRGDNANIAALDLELITNNLLIDYKKTGHDWNFKAGISGNYQTNFANPATGIRPLIPSFTKIDFGSYGIASYNFSDSFLLEGGLRYDFTDINATKYYQKSRWEERGYSQKYQHFIIEDFGTQWLTKPSFTFHNIAASLGIHKVSSQNWHWFANLSLAMRNPNPAEFFSDGLHHSSGVIELGGLQLQKEQASKLSVSVQHKGNLLSFDINPYVHFIKNYLFLSPIGFETTIRGAFPVWEHQQTNAFFVGLDAQINLRLTNNWQHTTTVSYVNGTDKTKNEPLINMPPFTMNNKISYTNKNWHQLQLELKSETVFAQNRYPNNNFYTNIIVNNAFEEVEVDISTPPPAYHLLHFYSEIKFNTFKKATITVAFSVQNIFNVSYRDYLNRQRFFADELGRSIQLQLKFNY